MDTSAYSNLKNVSLAVLWTDLRLLPNEKTGGKTRRATVRHTARHKSAIAAVKKTNVALGCTYMYTEVQIGGIYVSES